MDKIEDMDLYSDIEEYLRPAAKTYGREMVQLIVAAGLTREAVACLAKSTKFSEKEKIALRIIVEKFNSISNTYIDFQGWNAETLAQCENAIQKAFSDKHTIIQI